MLSNSRARAWKRVQKYVSGGAAAALLAGMLVVAGVGVQSAIAAPAEPIVTTAPSNPPLVAGAEGVVNVGFRNGSGAGGSAAVGPYNLSVTLLLPAGVKVTDAGALGTPTKVFTHADGALSGAYTTTPDYCADLGLEPAASSASKCQVPDGWQLFVFENISDLPASAANNTSVSLLPDADLFEPGSKIPYMFTGFTSDNANLIPVFPGSSSKATNATHTSAPGVESSEIAVEALRIEKREPSPERELLRGVHDHQTVYTLKISHTGEGDIANAKVVDYLPAGLEYLGSGEVDNTALANGNGGSEEYAGSGEMSGITPKPANWRQEESIVTVRGSFDSNGKFVESASGDVYTKVTWDLATLLAADGTAQNFGAKAAGEPGVLELEYVAGIPLFENSYVEGEFDEAVDGAHGARGQGANLDNNTGPSTRHGAASTPGDAGDSLAAWRPNALTNTAIASGDYTLQHPADPQAPVYSSSASGDVTVEAVDVRLVKSVNDSEFKQGGLATYTLSIATSEYVTAQLADAAGPSSEVRPNRLVDDLADGICPVFPPGVSVTPGASTQPDEIPNLRIGNPAAGIPADKSNLSTVEWNALLGTASECAFPSATSNAKLENASLTGIAFDPATGHFYLDLWIDGMGRSETTEVKYTALQSTVYSENDGTIGATSSGDRVSNSAEILMTTFPTDDTASVSNGEGVEVGGEYRASEDSQAYLEARTGGLKKYVLPRSAGAQSAEQVVELADDEWADELAPEPFAAGDEVWYKIVLQAPGNAEVRNPVLSDNLPAGVELPAGWPHSDGNGGFTDYVITPPEVLHDYGDCVAETPAEWLQRYVGNAAGAPTVSGNLLTWKLGSNECVDGNTEDRFLPIDSSITVYVKGVVTETSAAATLDLPQNLAKYQQQGRIGSTNEKEIFFLRDSAEIALVTTPELVKGIERNTFAGIIGLGAAGWKGVPDSSGNQQATPDYPAGTNHTGATTVPSADNPFWSNVDGEYAVQQDEVTFRIDVRSPMGNPEASVSSTNYVVWDALPVGVKAADVLQGAGKYRATTANIAWVNVAAPSDPEEWVQGLSEAPIDDSNVEFTVVDPGANGYPTDLATAYQGRSLVLWKLKNVAIPGSTPADPDDEHTGAINGFSLHYTVKVPSDSADPRRDALLGQHYENSASIVQYDALTTTSVVGSGTTLVPFGDDTLRNNGDDPEALPGGARAVDSEKTVDDSWFDVPNTAMKKTLVETQIKGDGTTTPNDTNNPVGVIAQGELATYDISVTIPAHTSVRGGVLQDGRTLARISGGSMNPTPANYQLKSSEVTADNGQTVETVQVDPATADSTKFIFNEKTGKLVFPEYYQNTSDDDQVFTVRLLVWMKDLDASHSATSTPPVSQSADRPQINNDALLRNTATFASKNTSGIANPQLKATADVTYREPNLTITKTASTTTNLAIGDTVTYTIAVSNPNRVKSYDNVVVDTLPAGLELQTGSFKIGATNSYTAGTSTALSASDLLVENGATLGTGGKITWNDPSSTKLAQLGEIPATVYLFYQAKIASAAGAGQSYRNDVEVTGYTLPSTLDGDAANRRGDRKATSNATVAAITAGFTKGVKIEGDESSSYGGSVSAPIGETVEYMVQATLEPKINYYNVQIEDTFTGSGIATPVRTFVSGPTALPADSVPGTWSRSTSGLKDTWTISGDHIAASDVRRTITIVYSVPLTSAITANQLGNTAKLSWTQTSSSSSTRSSTPDRTAQVNILNPLVGISKKVDDLDSITRNPDASFTYKVTVRNSGTAAANLTPAHNIEVQDVVPAGVKVDIAQQAFVDARVTFSNPTNIANGLGGTISWTVAEPLYPSAQAGAGKPNAHTLSYVATFVVSTDLGTAELVNTANVTHFESFDPDVAEGRSYNPPLTGNGSILDTASVVPLFPNVVPTKSVTNKVSGKQYGLAYVDTAFNWTLTVRNSGAGIAENIEVTDTLPKNWEYAGNAMISVNGAAAVPLATAPELTPATVARGEQLKWSAAAIRTAAATPLAAGASFVITFDAKPLEAAIDDAGTGIEVSEHAHVNTLSVTAFDTQGRDHNAVGDYVGEESTATAYIAEADLKLVKAAIGGVVSQADAGNADVPADNLHGLAAGTWVPGQAPVAGKYAAPQWQLTVTNHGPDASYGAFEFTDTNTLPAGVTIAGGAWSARYYSGASDTAGTSLPITVSGAGTVADPFAMQVGNATTSLKANGSDRIVVTANVSIGASALASGDELKNVATVVGQTFERDSKQGADAQNPNVDEQSKPLSAVADLSIAKTVTTAAADLGAGKPISWSLQVTNLGPATSVSGTQKITVSDTVPTGISGVANPSNPSWTAALNGAAWPADAKVKTGDVITWTYTGASIAPGAQVAAITLTGNLAPDWEPDAELTNAGQVTAGNTVDPNESNNESEITVTPGTQTEISIDKTRVVQNDEGVWVAAGDVNPVPAPVPGENVSYRITVVNNGPAVARGVHVTDALPSYLSFVSYESLVGAWNSDNVAGDQDLRFNLGGQLASPVGLAEGSTANQVSIVVTTRLDSNFVLDEDSVVANTAVANADNADPDSDDDQSNAPSRDAQLSIEKTHSGDPIAGTSIPYTITVTNDGPSAARGPIAITDTLPTGLSYVADSAEVSIEGGAATAIATSVSDDGSGLSWSVGESADTFTLPVDGAIVITLDVLIDAEITNGVKVNTATADGPDGPEISTTDEITIEREADMSLVKQVQNADGEWVDTADAVAGDQVSFLLTVTNAGPSANPATLVDALPDGLTLVSVAPVEQTSGWDCAASVAGSQRVDCANTLLAVGESQILVVTQLASNAVAGEANQTAEFVNTATLSWIDRNTTDPEQPNTDEDTATVTATAEADLVLTKRTWDAEAEQWGDAAEATAGTKAWYRVDVHNDGPSDVIAPIAIEDALPVGVTFDRLVSESTQLYWSATPGAVDPATGQQTVVFAPIDETAGLAAGDSLPALRYRVDVAAAVATGAELVNAATVTSGTTETDASNNTDTAQLDVVRQIDLGIEKSHDAEQVRVGDALPFTIDVTNHGPSEASGIVVTDTIPAGLEVLSETGPVLDADNVETGWTILSIELAEPGDDTVDPVIPANPAAGAIVTASYADPIAPGESAAPLTIDTLVTAAAYETVTNVAAVAANEPDPDPDTEHPNTVDDQVVVPPLVTLVVEKEAVGTFKVGAIGKYEITVDNLGPTADPGPVTVIDELPTGLSYASSPKLPEGVTVEVRGKTVTWTIADGLAVGERVSLELAVHVAQAAYPEVTNTVVVETPSELTDDSVLTDDAVVKVKPVDPLVVTGGDLAGGVLAAIALLVLLGGGVYVAGRRRQRARHA